MSWTNNCMELTSRTHPVQWTDSRIGSSPVGRSLSKIYLNVPGCWGRVHIRNRPNHLPQWKGARCSALQAGGDASRMVPRWGLGLSAASLGLAVWAWPPGSLEKPRRHSYRLPSGRGSSELAGAGGLQPRFCSPASGQNVQPLGTPDSGSLQRDHSLGHRARHRDA